MSEATCDNVGDLREMRIVPATPETILYGAVTDQAHLHGILAFLASLGLRIVSAHPLPAVPNDPTEVPH